MPDDPELRRLLWFLLGGTVGGETRARIVYALRERPSNINQLAGKLGLQYKAVQHHIVGAEEKFVDIILRGALRDDVHVDPVVGGPFQDLRRDLRSGGISAGGGNSEIQKQVRRTSLSGSSFLGVVYGLHKLGLQSAARHEKVARSQGLPERKPE